MTTRCPIAWFALALAFTLALTWAGANAQPSGPAQGATAPETAQKAPRLLTPAQARDAPIPPDEQRSEGAVLPQLSMPIGKSVPASAKPALRPARPDPAASSGGVNDDVARCEAQADASVRARCRARLAQQGRIR